MGRCCEADFFSAQIFNGNFANEDDGANISDRDETDLSGQNMSFIDPYLEIEKELQLPLTQSLCHDNG